MPLSPDDLARLFGGRLEGEGAAAAPLAGIAADSREVVAGGAFVALAGEREDGHAYVAAAAGRGAAVAIVSSHWRLPPGTPAPPLLLRVDDTGNALRSACRRRLAELGAVVVGITGSVGKTTAKEMCALALADRPTAKTPGNLNTWTGVPLSVLRVEEPVERFVVELAMSARGEIADLCEMVLPRIGVVLNIGTAHIGLLGSVEAIAEAKAELLDALPDDGAACLCADDPRVRRLAARTCAPVHWFGVHHESAVYRARDVEGGGLEGTSFVLETPRGSAPLRLRAPGEHLVVDACAAAAVAGALGVDVAGVAERLGTFEPPPQRGAVLTGSGGATVYDDSYNSSPTSLSAALRVLAASGAPRRVAVLGDMLELGDHAEDAHLRAGEEAARAATDLVAVGHHAEAVVRGAVASGMAPQRAAVAADVEDAAARALALCGPQTAVLVKASHSCALERVVERLTR